MFLEERNLFFDVGISFFIFFYIHQGKRREIPFSFFSFLFIKKKGGYSGVHPRVSTLIQPSFTKFSKKGDIVKKTAVERKVECCNTVKEKEDEVPFKFKKRRKMHRTDPVVGHPQQMLTRKKKIVDSGDLHKLWQHNRGNYTTPKKKYQKKNYLVVL